MHGLRRVGHLDSLVLKAPLDLEVGVLDTGEVFRVVEVVVSQNWIVANLTLLRGSSGSELRRVSDATRGDRDLGGR